MKKVYAVTGGIGSGKSTVCDILKGLGYPVYSADSVYENLIKNDNFSREIYGVLGLEFTKEKGFERSVVSAVVFNDANKLKLLNKFTHSKVMETLNSLNKAHTGLVFNEVPLLFESGLQSNYDGVIVVYRPLEDRINSVISRSGLSREEVLKRIKNQFNYENFDKTKHTVISNDGVLENLKRKVKEVLIEIEKTM